MSSGRSKLGDSEGEDGQLPPPAQDHFKDEPCAEAESGFLEIRTATGTGDDDNAGAVAAACSVRVQNLLLTPEAAAGQELRRDDSLYLSASEISVAQTPYRADDLGMSRLSVQNIASPPLLGATAVFSANHCRLLQDLDDAARGDAGGAEVGGLVGRATADQPVPVVSSSLQPHELHGMNCVLRREQDNPSGARGILVGLGKIVILEIFCKESDDPQGVHPQRQPPSSQNLAEGRVESRGTLLVSTRAAMEDYWEKELKAKCPKSAVLKFHGNTSREVARKLEASEVAAHDIVITTYDVVKHALFPYAHSRRAGAKSHQLLSIDWRRLVIDVVVGPGQPIKISNPAGKYCESVCALQAHHRWVLSGEPVSQMPRAKSALLNFLQLDSSDDMEILASMQICG